MHFFTWICPVLYLKSTYKPVMALQAYKLTWGPKPDKFRHYSMVFIIKLTCFARSVRHKHCCTVCIYLKSKVLSHIKCIKHGGKNLQIFVIEDHCAAIVGKRLLLLTLCDIRLQLTVSYKKIMKHNLFLTNIMYRKVELIRA